jgi:hypothetical protein
VRFDVVFFLYLVGWLLWAFGISRMYVYMGTGGLVRGRTGERDLLIPSFFCFSLEILG